MSLTPICVDLDGTLIQEDVTWLAVHRLTSRCVFNYFRIACWLCRGRAYLKRKLADNVDLDPSSLRYNSRLLDYLMAKKREGVSLFLATACDQKYARLVAHHLGIFDGVFASNGVINLRARAKADALVAAFGVNGFSYAGNSYDDVQVWKYSLEKILVTPSDSALKYMKTAKCIYIGNE